MTTSKPEDKRDSSYGDYWSGKKPYLVHDYRKMMQKKTQEEYYFHELHEDPMSELLRPYLADPNIEGFGWEYMEPPGVDLPPGIEPPSGWPIPGDCQLACNPSMLDCEGGCTIIACICASGGLSAEIAEDPTGSATVNVLNNTMVQVCIEPFQTDTEYPFIVVAIQDSDEQVLVRVAIVDCEECCDTSEISGSATVNPGATWTGTISPACPGASCSVSSNSGCSGFSCVVSGSGSTVAVTVPSDACGTFTVTVTDDEDECGDSFSASVRINDTGQGGEWVHDASSSSLGLAGCLDTCGCGGGVTNYGTYCIDGEYKYGGFDPTGNNPCEGTASSQCKSAGSGYPCSNPPGCVDESGTNPCPAIWSKSCSAGYPCIYWGWWRCTWECTC